MPRSETLTGTCHCGAVAFEVSRPDFIVACNCSICRRYAALWVHAPPATARLTKGADQTTPYIWGDGDIAFHSCKTCGCVTHWQGTDATDGGRWAVNMRMTDPDARANIRLRHFDGADSWEFLD